MTDMDRRWRGMGTRKEIGKVLLFRSPLVYHESIGHEDPHPPLELLYLAASLRKDFDVKVLDGEKQRENVEDFGRQKRMGLSDRQILREALAFAPDLIGISIMWHHQIPAALYFAELLKKNLPEVLIVAGGIGSVPPDLIIKSAYVDFVISGDGEWALPNLCHTLATMGDLSWVPGLTVRDGDGIISFPKRNVESADDIPFPAFEMIELSHYDSGYKRGVHKSYPMAGILATRGCPLSCHFCSLPGVRDHIFRHHSVERIVSDLLHMRHNFGIREIHFYDDNMVNDQLFIKTLFKAMVEYNVNTPWLAEAGFAVWKIDEELLELAKASGMYRLDLPIETASERVKTHVMDKGLYHNNKVASIVKLARKVGIERLFGYVIVGSPGETIEDIKQTLDFVNSLDLDYRGVRFAQPFPGTQFYRICVENGFLTTEFSLDRLWFSIPNIETKDFTINEVTTLIAADRAAAMIQQGKVGFKDAVGEIRVKYSDRIADEAAALIPELQQRYEARIRELQAILATGPGTVIQEVR